MCTKFVSALNSSETMPNMDENRKRHCWECLRRRVVCDSTRPACNKCSKAGSQCPGYGDVKPARLRWLPPGKIISRQQKKNGTMDPESERHPIAMAANNVDEVISPKFSMGSETSALIEAVEQHLRIRRFTSYTRTWAAPWHISRHAYPSPERGWLS